jgi:hypothetical protein
MRLSSFSDHLLVLIRHESHAPATGVYLITPASLNSPRSGIYTDVTCQSTQDFSKKNECPPVLRLLLIVVALLPSEDRCVVCFTEDLADFDLQAVRRNQSQIDCPPHANRNNDEHP